MLQKKEVKIKKLSNVITQISLLGILCILVLCIWVMPAAAITWGDLDEDDLFPNVGMVGISVSGVPETICSGTLIAPSVVLTAGHCIDYVLMLEQFFDLYLSNALPGQGLPVTRYIIHTDYYWGPQSNPHDVGDLILEQPVDITPAELPELGFLDELKADGMLGKGRNKAKFTVVDCHRTMPQMMKAPVLVIPVDQSFILIPMDMNFSLALPLRVTRIVCRLALIIGLISWRRWILLKMS
jgi:hypothetical protein